MSGRQRAEHLWEYYRYHALAAVFVLLMAVFAVRGQIRAHQQVLISGIFINESTDDEGWKFVSDDYWRACGGKRTERVDLIKTSWIDFSDADPQGESAKLASTVDLLISVQELDYMIVDETALQYYLNADAFLDPRSCLPPALTERLASCLVEREGACVAIALDASSFDTKNGLNNPPAYLVLLKNAPDQERIQRFLEYFFADETN